TFTITTNLSRWVGVFLHLGIRILKGLRVEGSHLAFLSLPSTSVLYNSSQNLETLVMSALPRDKLSERIRRCGVDGDVSKPNSATFYKITG
ncbi:hypothetical protein ACQP3F_30455, partial [Escherichia coli]